PMESMEGFSVGVIEEGASGANPAVFPNTVYNAAGGQVAIKIGALGPASTVTVGHAAGASSLCYGCELAGADHADAMLCLGADSLIDTVIAAYRELGVLGSPADGGGSPEDGGGSRADGGGSRADGGGSPADGGGSPGMALSEA